MITREYAGNDDPGASRCLGERIKTSPGTKSEGGIKRRVPQPSVSSSP